ncbi:MAG: hypothetical protein ACKO3F_06705, partial [Cyanobium sp.]
VDRRWQLAHLPAARATALPAALQGAPLTPFPERRNRTELPRLYPVRLEDLQQNDRVLISDNQDSQRPWQQSTKLGRISGCDQIPIEGSAAAAIGIADCCAWADQTSSTSEALEGCLWSWSPPSRHPPR